MKELKKITSLWRKQKNNRGTIAKTGVLHLRCFLLPKLYEEYKEGYSEHRTT